MLILKRFKNVTPVNPVSCVLRIVEGEKVSETVKEKWDHLKTGGCSPRVPICFCLGSFTSIFVDFISLQYNHMIRSVSGFGSDAVDTDMSGMIV